MNRGAFDPHDLQRFVDAQARDFERALAELQAGCKQSHWIWYVLPQMKGLGSSPMARAFGIASWQEAEAYLVHPVLAPRLEACVAALLALEGRSADQVMGPVDAMKLRSCLTLFGEVEGPGSVFEQALGRYFGGEPDAKTLDLLAPTRPRAP